MNRQKSLRSTVCVALCVMMLSSLGCTEYWWTRGQPPSVAELMARAQGKLSVSREKHGERRHVVAAASEQLELSLQQAVSLVRNAAPATEVAEQLSLAEQSFLELDPEVSVGSRAALGELAAQLRDLSSSTQSGTLPSYESIGLFTARTLSFLANELLMPAVGTETAARIAESVHI